MTSETTGAEQNDEGWTKKDQPQEPTLVTSPTTREEGPMTQTDLQVLLAANRTHDQAHVDIGDLAAVRKAVENASAVGHWRRILAIYGDHLPACQTRAFEAGACDCGWGGAFDP